VFPRGDATIIGGTNRFGDATTHPEPDVSRGLIASLKGVFGVGPIVPVPTFHIDHPENEQYMATEKVSDAEVS
jgi:hypothetical protein